MHDKYTCAYETNIHDACSVTVQQKKNIKVKTWPKKAFKKSWIKHPNVDMRHVVRTKINECIMHVHVHIIHVVRTKINKCLPQRPPAAPPL
jgi:transcriptional accessory protein Tex/SPT6